MKGSPRAMMILGGSKEHGRTLSADAFAGQHLDERGFFISLHELTSTYPTLSRLVSDLLALKTGQPVGKPSRNSFAYFFACFIPGGNIGGGGRGPIAAMMMVVMIRLLAAMAIPAFQKVRQESQKIHSLKHCYSEQSKTPMLLSYWIRIIVWSSKVY